MLSKRNGEKEKNNFSWKEIIKGKVIEDLKAISEHEYIHEKKVESASLYWY